MVPNSKKNYSLGPVFIEMVENMAKREERSQAAVVRRAIRDYAKVHHPDFLYFEPQDKTIISSEPPPPRRPRLFEKYTQDI